MSPTRQAAFRLWMVAAATPRRRPGAPSPWRRSTRGECPSHWRSTQTHTLYVASNAGQVFVITSPSARLVHCWVWPPGQAGCRHPGPCRDRRGPGHQHGLRRQRRSRLQRGDTVSVIDGATCDATVGTGCDGRPHGHGRQRAGLGRGRPGDRHRLCGQQQRDGTVSVHRRATCNAQSQSGCANVPPAATTGTGVACRGDDTSLNTLFAMNQGDDTLSEINTATCQGSNTSRCPQRARNQTVPNPPGGFGANSFASDPAPVPPIWPTRADSPRWR